jgi:hypothetical protein
VATPEARALAIEGAAAKALVERRIRVERKAVFIRPSFARWMCTLLPIAELTKTKSAKGPLRLSAAGTRSTARFNEAGGTPPLKDRCQRIGQWPDGP